MYWRAYIMIAYESSYAAALGSWTADEIPSEHVKAGPEPGLDCLLIVPTSLRHSGTKHEPRHQGFVSCSTV